MKNKIPTTASINPESPRYEEWLKVFSTSTVPLQSFIPEHVSLPGIKSATVYKMDVKALSREQRQRLIDHIAAKFNAAPDEVALGIDGPHGVPILADDVTVSADGRDVLAMIL